MHGFHILPLAPVRVVIYKFVAQSRLVRIHVSGIYFELREGKWQYICVSNTSGFMLVFVCMCALGLWLLLLSRPSGLHCGQRVNGGQA